MKTKLILGGLLAFTTIANAQWTTSGNDVYKTNTAGNVGIGTTAPGYKLDVKTSATNDGVGISQSGTSAAVLFLNNLASGGRSWSIFSTGSANTQGAGHFFIHDYTSGNIPFFIESTSFKIGIGTTTPADKLSVAGNVAPSSDGVYTCGTSSNRWSAVWATNGTIQTSDLRYKTNVKNLAYGLQDVLKLRPVSYNWKDGDKATHIGLIAQELKGVINEAVYEGDDANKRLGVAYSDLIPVLIHAIQEQQAQIESQQQQLQALTQKSGATTGINSINEVETGFQMSQNEPNPFTHETVVKYTLPQTISNAFMAVYDLTGKQIATFPINEKGSSSLTITSEKLAAGIYIYSIVADGKVVDSKRMIVSEK